MENTGQIRKERFLWMRFFSIKNGQEMFEHLKAIDFKSIVLRPPVSKKYLNESLNNEFCV